jgi:mono/diheme cytochrome c family protein
LNRSQRLVLAAAGATMAGMAMDGVAAPPGGDAHAGRALYRAQCAGCHNADGSGGREGGVAVPAIDWTTLVRPRLIAPPRPAYDGSAFERAVATGVDAAGRPLAPAMPRMSLTPADLDRLRGYLTIIGTPSDPEPGVGPAEIRIGAVLPLSGPDARVGRTVQAAVGAAFAAAGPIYGRVLRLDVEDASGAVPTTIARGDVAAAAARLTSGDRVLALVATLMPGPEDVSLPAANLSPRYAYPAPPVVGRLDMSSGHEDAQATGAAATLIEALKQVGARPTRAALSAVLKTLRDNGSAALTEVSTDKSARER